MTNNISSSDIPAAARIYDYLAGGSFPGPADRHAAEQMAALVPSIRKWLPMLRAYLQRAAQVLWDRGITQFVDFGSGLPSDSHIHAVLPQAKIIYVDIDPYVVAEGQRLLGAHPNARYLAGDVREADRLLAQPEVRAFVDSSRPIAFGLSGVSVFFAPSELNAIYQALHAWAPAGSKVYTNYETKDPSLMTDKLQQFIDALTAAGGPYQFYTIEQCREVGHPWRLTPPGLVPLSQFLGLPDGYVTPEDREGVNIEFYAAILEK